MASKLDQPGFTPPVDTSKPLPDIGLEDISGDRFCSPEWMRLEWKHMWRRVWNMACRVSDLPEPGDHFVFELGKESFIFVRGQDDKIRGFYNVCQHRGNQLCLGGEGPGHSPHFQCAYHGWEWHLDGSNKRIPQLESFQQFKQGVPPERVALEPVDVDVWGGWVFFRMEPGGESLMDFLGVIPDHLAPYALEKWDIVDYKTFEWPCNWKAACDAFNESYHFETLHHQMMQWSNGYADVELLGIHSRMVNQYGTVDPRHPDQVNPGPELQAYMTLVGIDPAKFDGLPADVRLQVQKMKRAVQDDVYLPYRNMRDDQLSDTYHYTIFPNVSWNVTSESINGFRYRPHPADPNLCYYDLIIMRHLPPDAPKPDYTHRVYPVDALPKNYGEALDLQMHPIITKVLEQDGSNLGPVQKGLSSDGFRGMILCDQEARVRLFHKVVEEYVTGKR